ncbi:MAG: sulfotransferase, partial [Promethearchaeota archaeon]
QLLKKYPNAKFIHIIRDPLINLASLKKNLAFRNRVFLPLGLVLYLQNSIKMAENNLKKYGRNVYYVLRYEDLVSKTKKYMKEISNFLNIDYQKDLCFPTINSKPATSNSMFEDSRVIGVVKNQSHNYRWLTELSDKEKKIAISTLFDVAIKLDYSEWKKEYVLKYYHAFYAKFINFIYRRFIDILQKIKFRDYVKLTKLKSLLINYLLIFL